MLFIYNITSFIGNRLSWSADVKSADLFIIALLHQTGILQHTRDTLLTVKSVPSATTNVSNAPTIVVASNTRAGLTPKPLRSCKKIRAFLTICGGIWGIWGFFVSLQGGVA